MNQREATKENWSMCMECGAKTPIISCRCGNSTVLKWGAMAMSGPWSEARWWITCPNKSCALTTGYQKSPRETIRLWFSLQGFPEPQWPEETEEI